LRIVILALFFPFIRCMKVTVFVKVNALLKFIEPVRRTTKSMLLLLWVTIPVTVMKRLTVITWKIENWHYPVLAPHGVTWGLEAPASHGELRPDLNIPVTSENVAHNLLTIHRKLMVDLKRLHLRIIFDL